MVITGEDRKSDVFADPTRDQYFKLLFGQESHKATLDLYLLPCGLDIYEHKLKIVITCWICKETSDWRSSPMVTILRDA